MDELSFNVNEVIEILMEGARAGTEVGEVRTLIPGSPPLPHIFPWDDRSSQLVFRLQ